MEQKHKLLIVDDETDLLNVYQAYFTKRGFKVDVASNGIEGLEKLRQGGFEVAIIDVKMPRMDGITLAKKIQEEGIDTNIIILSGQGNKEDAVAAINIGVDAWFEKQDINMNDLLVKVEELAEAVPIDIIRKILSAVP